MLSDNISRAADGSLRFAGQSVPALAEHYGTPLYLMDEERIRANCRMYLDAFRAAFGGAALPLYAGKAASFKQMYRIMAAEGMGVEAVSQGEIHTVLSVGYPAGRIYFHGDGKTPADVRFAMEHGIGCFIVDNEHELALVDAEARRLGRRQKVLLRITPGIDPHTYEAVNTGTVDVKFGVPLETGQAFAFVQEALALEGLEVAGLHCHVGSMVFDEDVFERTLDIMVGFMTSLYRSLGFVTRELNVGGGYGVRYLESDRQADIPARIGEVARRLHQQCALLDFPLPRVLMEPGRSIVADAGMTLYTVQSVKRLPGYKSYAAVDGGMGDNPRYALYQAPYTVLAVEPGEGPAAVYDLVGRYCESGDILQPAVSLPAELRRGDLVAVCTTGAYNYSMASNYNRVGRSPVVMLTKEGSYTAVRRETPEDLCALDR